MDTLQNKKSDVCLQKLDFYNNISLKTRAQTMHMLKRGKVPSKERAHFKFNKKKNDDVILSKVIDQIMIFFQHTKFGYNIFML